jgi:hypothetical protein
LAARAGQSRRHDLCRCRRPSSGVGRGHGRVQKERDPDVGRWERTCRVGDPLRRAFMTDANPGNARQARRPASRPKLPTQSVMSPPGGDHLAGSRGPGAAAVAFWRWRPGDHPASRCPGCHLS